MSTEDLLRANGLSVDLIQRLCAEALGVEAISEDLGDNPYDFPEDD
jgi:hypothetical protein